MSRFATKGLMLGVALTVLAPIAAADQQKKADDVQFVETLKAYMDQYAAAKNDIKKSQVFNDARNWADKQVLADYLQGTINQWHGRIAKLDTSKGGKELRLRVALGTKKKGFTVTFGQGWALGSDGIAPDSPVYQAAADFAEGDCVVFSGTVRPKEGSLSERGAMTAPEYVIAFSDLQKCEGEVSHRNGHPAATACELEPMSMVLEPR